MESGTVRRPAPRVDSTNRPFWDGCNASRLVIQQCAAEGCRRFVYYPKVCCPFCRSGELNWVEVSGFGTVVSHTTIHRPHHPSFESEAPYLFGAVRLREGPIVYARLHSSLNAPSLIGQTVRGVFVPHVPGQNILEFEVISEDARRKPGEGQTGTSG